MIPLFFIKKFTVNSPLSQEEVVERLTEVVMPPRGFTFNPFSVENLFEGYVSTNGFQISRAIAYRNSFLPSISGRFLPCDTGSQIRIVMLLHPIILLIMASMGILAGSFMLGVLYESISMGYMDDMLKTPVKIIGLIYTVSTLGFGIEANIASRMLKRIFDVK